MFEEIDVYPDLKIAIYTCIETLHDTPLIYNFSCLHVS
jgi:hypothetical protein